MVSQFKELHALITRRGGLARTNRFEVLFVLPPGIDSGDGGRSLTLLCESASFPGKQITTLEWSLFGHASKIPTGFLYEDVTLVFNVTSDYYVKKIFDSWQKLAISENTYNLAYDSSYKADVIITQLDEADQPLYSISLEGAYPITVQSIAVDSGSESSTQKMSTTLTFVNLKTL